MILKSLTDRLLLKPNLSALISEFHTKVYPDRFFCAWLNNWFNRVDRDRLKKFGSDRTCAEWILKNGGAVKFVIQKDMITDYNSMAPESSELVKDHLVEIYADGISLTDKGFEHLKDCSHISKITLCKCHHLQDNGLPRLHYIKNSLKYLEIRSCNAISDKAILSLTELRNLKKLILHNLPGIVNKSTCETALRNALQTTDLDLKL